MFVLSHCRPHFPGPVGDAAVLWDVLVEVSLKGKGAFFSAGNPGSGEGGGVPLCEWSVSCAALVIHGRVFVQQALVDTSHINKKEAQPRLHIWRYDSLIVTSREPQTCFTLLASLSCSAQELDELKAI